MYLIGITNFIGTEYWNSYTSAFRAPINIKITNIYHGVLTNESGTIISNYTQRFSFTNALTQIPGALFGRILNTNSFWVMSGAVPFIPESQYTNYPNAPYFVPVRTNAAFEQDGRFYIPHWGLTITNQTVAIVEHQTTGRILDFVNIELPNYIDLTKHLLTSLEEENVDLAGGVDFNPNHLWLTNRANNSPSISTPTLGVLNQIQVSQGNFSEGQIEQLWRDFSPKTTGNLAGKKRQIDEFRVFLGLTPRFGSSNLAPGLRIQAPFSPTRTLYFNSSLQANDPLVHYTLTDMQDFRRPADPELLKPATQSYSQYSKNNLRKINNRYNPWGGKRVPTQNPDSSSEVDPQMNFEMALKDPMVRWSDDWDFATNKFANVGWLGRVHRGTPWQTIYLKAKVADTNLWRQWSGSLDTHATNDWFLVDVFTTAPNDNAARGLLSVNQGELASWSAVLSGVQVLSNSLPNNSGRLDGIRPLEFSVEQIEPSSPQLTNIVNSINAARAARPNGVFGSVAEVLSAPALTIGTGTNGSPFLNLADVQRNAGLNDAAVERIPQQILSLLKVGHPRVVVYSYGQALKPAENSIVLNPPNRSLMNICTNYQITGEVVTRTVLRVEGTPQNPKAVIESFKIVSED